MFINKEYISSLLVSCKTSSVELEFAKSLARYARRFGWAFVISTTKWLSNDSSTFTLHIRFGRDVTEGIEES